MNTAPQQMELALMTMEEAEACIARIKSAATSIRAALVEFEARQGWIPLGYRSMRACVRIEFGLAHPELYRELAAANVEQNLGVEIGSIPESQARELKRLPPDEQRRIWEAVKSDDTSRLTARRIREVAAEVRPPSPTLPEANGDEPAPPGEVAGTCRECKRHFTETLAPDQIASSTCPRCRARAERGATQGPTPTPEGEGAPDAASTHGDTAGGARRLEHTASPAPDLRTGWSRTCCDGLHESCPVEGCLCPCHGEPGAERKEKMAPAHGIAASTPYAAPSPPPPPDAPAPRQAVRPPYVDPDDSAAEYVGAPASDDLDWLHARDITLAQALTLARRLIVACEAKGKTAEWGIGLLERPSVK